MKLEIIRYVSMQILSRLLQHVQQSVIHHFLLFLFALPSKEAFVDIWSTQREDVCIDPEEVRSLTLPSNNRSLEKN